MITPELILSSSFERSWEFPVRMSLPFTADCELTSPCDLPINSSPLSTKSSSSFLAAVLSFFAHWPGCFTIFYNPPVSSSPTVQAASTPLIFLPTSTALAFEFPTATLFPTPDQKPLFTPEPAPAPSSIGATHFPIAVLTCRAK